MIVLCADDYAMSEAVSRGIEDLAAAGRVSAVSVLVTSPRWTIDAPRLKPLRAQVALGVHLNLTYGAPLGPMPRLAPDRLFPPLGRLLLRTVLGRLDSGEIRDEFSRQLDAFERTVGHPPDHVDGHEHVHVLPAIRQALFDALSRRFMEPAPLLRDPSDRLGAIVRRRGARTKALAVKTLAFGFGAAARRRGLPTNEGFSGFSRFDVNRPYAQELQEALSAPGPCHIAMCHPGRADEGAAPGGRRRRMEYDVLMADRTLPNRIWRPQRAQNGPVIDWVASRTEMR
jgi:predicted glycoside hydrolase/deacetylase ChbG (UPF0249 family)